MQLAIELIPSHVICVHDRKKLLSVFYFENAELTNINYKMFKNRHGSLI